MGWELLCFVSWTCGAKTRTTSGEITSHNNSILFGLAAKVSLRGSRACHCKMGQLHGISKQTPRSELFFYRFVCSEAQFQCMCLGSYSAANNICALAQICLSRRTEVHTDTHAHMHTWTARSSSRISHTLEDRCFQACWKTRRRRTFIL